MEFFKHDGLEWCAENFESDKFNNGDQIQESKTQDQWRTAAANKTPTWMWNSQEDPKFKLYNYYCLKDPRGILSDEITIPKIDELKSLVHLKEGVLHNPFNLPNAGYIGSSGSIALEEYGFYWSKSSDGGPSYKYYLSFSKQQNNINPGSDKLSVGYMLRCRKKTEEELNQNGWHHGNTKPIKN